MKTEGKKEMWKVDEELLDDGERGKERKKPTVDSIQGELPPRAMCAKRAEL